MGDRCGQGQARRGIACGGMVSMQRHWTAADIPSLQGRTAVVTGASGGLGRCVARELAAHGARVVLACRDPAKGELVAAAIRSAGSPAEPLVAQVDLADLGSVRAVAKLLEGELDRIDILVNNAGVMGIERMTSPDGFELQLATNYLGHFALTNLVAGLLLAAPAAMVVSVASIVHWMGRIDLTDLNGEKRYGKMRAYAQSKLAALLFTLELDRRLRAGGRSARALAAHPGWARTNLQAVGPQMSGARVVGALSEIFTVVFAQSDSKGALPLLRAATDPAVEGGSYLGPHGVGGLHGYPVPARRSRRAADADLAGRLWGISEEMTAVRSAF